MVVFGDITWKYAKPNFFISQLVRFAFVLELPNVQHIPPGSCAEKYLQLELEKLKEENQALGSELAEMKSKDGCTVGDDAIVGSIPTDQGGTL